ncbi:diol dehydratase small subunit [Actinomycetospora sp. TBRC 11914]|uniref:diol dehydratase small subunit n=1 Tax=Actinomycetospora sp. TBRC 11914 TaxID=2729387 RepID=UPI00145D3C86|nr:diol dehydratase small subunit [Actinomycetospora sp. TBRC 11914]NMO89197.1 diol dehydratase small subunit [Actinomycetospora sp. TBRC 11914]
MTSDVSELTPADYPLSINRPDLLRTPTGKALGDITMAGVVSGEVTNEDLRVTPDTLVMQGQIAESVGRRQLGENCRRAAEMTAIPDEEVLAMYNALRPNASTAAQLEEIASRLEGTYSASTCAALVREAAQVYAARTLLAEEDS